MSVQSDRVASNVRSKLKELKWIPRNFGRELLHTRAIDTLLKEIRDNTEGLTEKDTLAFKEFVLNQAPQLCIMLIRFKKFELIEKFYRCGINDSHFPLDAWQDDNDPDIMHITHPQTTLRIDDETSDHLFCSDNPLQHQFFVPVLEWKGFNDASMMGKLPYLTKPVTISTTDCSIVRKTTVHRQHIDIGNNGLKVEVDKDNNPLVAIKELLRTTMTAIQFQNLVRREYNCLRRLRSSEFNTPHLIRAAAFYRKGDSLFFIFPWAPHGNLLKFWEEKSPNTYDPNYVQWLFSQLLGMGQAVQSLHSPEINIRHGDLKPNNILCFESSDPGSNAPYVFAISDMGMAKEHERLTQFRSQSKQPGGGTMVYAAPEMETHENCATSRRYDIWSLGCIYLESIIWLLYGIEGLQRFSEDKSGKFYRIQDNTNALQPRGSVKTAELDPAVLLWISNAIKISRTATSKSTAVSCILEVIRDRLLVIDANSDHVNLESPDHDEAVSMRSIPRVPFFDFKRAQTDPKRSISNKRAYADEVCSKISEIIRQAETGQIEWVGRGESTLPTAPKSPLDPAQSGFRDNEYVPIDLPERVPVKEDSLSSQTSTALSEYVPHKEASAEVVDSFAPPALSRKVSNICVRCRNLAILQENEILNATVGELMKGSTLCDLCQLLCRVLKYTATTPNDFLRFFRVGSTIRINNQQLPAILSLSTVPFEGECRNPHIQVGHPRLSDAGDRRHVDVLTGWLRNCDQDHDCLHHENEPFLPTRLIDVSFAATRCRLILDTQLLPRDSRYLALSHRWSTRHESSLVQKIVCTYKSNMQYLAGGVDDSSFPALYQDAIQITRKLGVCYLWIDSLCIIQAEPANPEDQDQGRDFQREARKMERVFSDAYATIAATCARSPAEHFLKCRPERKFATILTEQGLYYLSEAIDQFSVDVDQSELNSRGWVFQERALSRRTIYFAEKQTYWECGEGVQCETLTKIENNKGSGLGDANFPFALPDYDKDTRQRFHQSLYERYTKLKFTHPTDRPIAIRGLETRLLRAFDTPGRYGVFEKYLRRGLLWKRKEPSLLPIDFSKSPNGNAHEFVPSWSWMAYDGPIEYMEIPAAAEWTAWHADVRSPWDQNDCAKPFELRVLVRDVVDFAPSGYIMLDDPSCTSEHESKCVVVGSKPAPDPMQAEVYYSLIVTPTHDDICQRVGVAFLKRRHIDWKSPPVAMRVH